MTIIDGVSRKERAARTLPERYASRRMTGQMEHLELPIAGFDDVPFRDKPGRFHGRTAIRLQIVAGEWNGLEHEFGRLDS